MEKKIYEIIIIGGGPAGCSAAVYAARKQVHTLLLTSEFGGQSVVSDDIQNWIGTPHISGSDLAKNLKSHVYEYKGNVLEVIENTKVVSVEKHEKTFHVTTEGGQVYESLTVLMTAGSSRKKLTVPGADRLEHKGLTYCASCDGPLFSGSDVIVIGGGNAAFETVLQLVAYCKHVTLVNRSENFRADEITVSKVKNHPKVTIRTNVDIVEVLGDSFVSGIKIYDKITSQEDTLEALGIFVEIGQTSNGEFLKNIVDVTEGGKIKIDPWTQRTSCDGLWAAGDVTNILYHQNNIASGDAVKALEDIYQWLQKQ
jgi:alkyl hydroperoxide reductase subunit F